MTAVDGDRQGWDEIVVGAGTSGALLAARLSEDPCRRVLLLEAGADGYATPGGLDLLGDGGVPVLSGYNWDHSAYVQERGGREFPYLLGKGVGGSSAVNGSMALQPRPADFDAWAAAGNPAWAWTEVAPVLAALTGAGRPGPGAVLPVSRGPAAGLSPVAAAFLQTCRRTGLAGVADLNDGHAPGAGVVPSSSAAGRRTHPAVTCLGPARARPNLTVRADTPVVGVLLDGGRASGVQVRSRGGTVRLRADRVTLAAGAVGTPVLLQRSGIGDPDRLRAVGVTAHVDLPGVGENLVDHPAVALWTRPRAGACRPGAPWHEVMVRAASSTGDPDLDLFLVGVAGDGGPVVARMAGAGAGVALSVVLVSPASRGRVSLRAADPDAPPEIVLRLASDPADVPRLMAGVRLAWTLLRSDPLAGHLDRVLLWTDRMVADDNLLRSAVARFATPTWHPVGTARMGRSDDRMAVVDERFRVHGVDGLRVVDASVMPTIPSAPPHLTCLVLAERAAGWS